MHSVIGCKYISHHVTWLDRPSTECLCQHSNTGRRWSKVTKKSVLPAVKWLVACLRKLFLWLWRLKQINEHIIHSINCILFWYVKYDQSRNSYHSCVSIILKYVISHNSRNLTLFTLYTRDLFVLARFLVPRQNVRFPNPNAPTWTFRRQPFVVGRFAVMSWPICRDCHDWFVVMSWPICRDVLTDFQI